jgi:hypothetical protein
LFDTSEFATGAMRHSVDQLFEQRLEGVFGTANRSMLVGLAQLKLDAAGDGGFLESGLAIRVIETIERHLAPAVDEALVSYDLATNRLFPRRSELQRSIKGRIENSIDLGFATFLRGAEAFRDPWQAPLENCRSDVAARLHRVVDQHATGLATTGLRREFKPWWDADPRLRILRWLIALIAGALLGWLLKSVAN